VILKSNSVPVICSDPHIIKISKQHSGDLRILGAILIVL